MAKLQKGDTLSLTLGINMPVGDDRSNPWIKAEASSTTTVGKDETYKEAKERLYKEVYTRMDKAINRLFDEVLKAKK